MAGDCDDTSLAVYPGAQKLCGDEIDNDCDAKIDVKANGEACVFCDHYQMTVPKNECLALEAFHEATNGTGWTDSTNWLTDPDVDTWFGVTTEVVDGGNHVTRLTSEESSV